MGARSSKPSAPASSSTPVVDVGHVVVGTPVETPAGQTPAVEKPAGQTPALKHDDSVNPSPSPQLDLLFTMDCTGSMGSYIHAAKQNIQVIVDRLVQSEGYDLRFGLIGYRDHPPQDQSYVTKQFDFTADVSQMQANLRMLSAQGGGDGPEAVEAGLKAALDSGWRPAATKVCILIADAPPHGLGERGDGFPEGAPTGVDPIVVLEQMSCQGITVYSVGCEPALSQYRHAKPFMVAAAQKTNGQAVSLGSAAALADVIMGGAVEEMDLERLAVEVRSEVAKIRSAKGEDAGYDSEEERQEAFRALGVKGHVTRHMKTKKLRSSRADVVQSASTLADARACLSASTAPAKGPAKLQAARRRTSHSRMRSLAAAAESGSDDDWGAGSDSDRGEEEEVDSSERGVRLESRALSFSQMSRIYGKQKKMGFF